MTNPTDTAEEAARAKLSWIESECPDFYDALILDVTTLLRERERAGIERAATVIEQMREALKPFAMRADAFVSWANGDMVSLTKAINGPAMNGVSVGDLRRALQAYALLPKEGT